MRDRIRVGDQAFVEGTVEEFGAVREVSRKGIVVYVENAGEFVVPFEAVTAAHSQKVVFRKDQLDPALQLAILHAHDAEEPGA